MARLSFNLFALFALAISSNAYFLMGMENILTQQRLDPIADKGKVSPHVHTVVGGSNFGPELTTALLRQSKCTSTPLKEDKSNYWVPSMYFQWKNGSFSSVGGNIVIYYLFDDAPGKTTPFPDDFRMISGDPTLRSYDPSSKAQQAVTFLCLDFQGTPQRFNSFPTVACPNGIRAQINFQSCWDGKNVDSEDHQSHVAYPSGGPDSGACTDPKFPVTLPRIFMEYYTESAVWDKLRDKAMNSSQPYVFSTGDPTGYSFHGDFFMGWDDGVLKKVVDGCNCNPFGDPTCCAEKGIFTKKPDGQSCTIQDTVQEQVLGTLSKLPGNNPLRGYGPKAPSLVDTNPPKLVGGSRAIAPSASSPINASTQAPAVASAGAPGGVRGGAYNAGAYNEGGAYVDAPAASSSPPATPAPSSDPVTFPKTCSTRKRRSSKLEAHNKVIKRRLRAHHSRFSDSRF